MTRRRFFIQLLLLTAALVVAVLLLQLLPVFQPSFWFSMFTIGLFAFVSICLFFLGAKTAVSKDKNAFTRTVMVCTFGKLFLAFGVVIVYHKSFQPEGKLFLFPFFTIYFAYTVFETLFLSKLGKIKAH